ASRRAAHAHHAFALAAGVVAHESADFGDRVGGAQHRRLQVQVRAAGAADLALVAEVGTGADELADLELRLAAARALGHVAVLGRFAVGVADPDVVVLLLAVRQALAGQARAVAILDVGDAAVGRGHDPVGAAAAAVHVVAALRR